MRSLARTGRLVLGLGWEIGSGVFLAWIGVTLAGTLGPLLFAFGLKPLVDGIHYDHDGDAAIGAVVCSMALLTMAITPAAARWVTARVRERAIMAWQRRVLTLGARAPGLSHFERPDFWDQLQLLKRSSGGLMEGTANILTGPLVLGELVVASAVLARVEPLMLLLPLVALPLAWLSQRSEAVTRIADERTAERRRTAQHLFGLASSAPSAKEVRISRLESELLVRHRDISAEIQRTNEAAILRATALSAAGWLLLSLAFAGAITLALRAAGGGQATPGDVALTLALATALVAASGRLSALAGQVSRAIAAADRYFWLVEQIEESGVRAPHPPVAVPARITRGFDLSDVRFTYATGGLAALDGVSLHLGAGAVIAVVGENGAGKTTLVKLLSRMYEPDSGEIRLDGTELHSFDVAEYRRRISAGFQDFMRFELVVRENVGVGDLPRIAEREPVNHALLKANGDFVERLPAGLETQLGRSWDGGVDLSGGEWQKLALARALMREHPLLVVFDEPTSSLDAQTEHALFERVAADARAAAPVDGRITVLISHRFSTVRMADVVVVLDRGHVLEQGSHEELMARRGLYAELYELQARAYR